MFDTYKMQEILCKELERKTEAGIKSPSDLEIVWKLSDTYKNMLKIDKLQEAAEGGYSGNYSYDDDDEDGYSERGRKRDSMGRYSRSDGATATVRGGRNSYNYSERGYSRHGEDPHERYMEAKNSYASTKAPEHKRKMIEALKEDMAEMQEKMQEMMRNSDCREERDIIKTYMDGLTKII